jgi:hypothetical protein
MERSEFEDVPPGPYILSITAADTDLVSGWVRTDDEITLVSQRLGRSDPVRPDGPPTIDLAVTNLAPWQITGSGDALWLAVPNVAMVTYLPVSSVIGQGLERGATELLEPMFVWDQYLVDPAKGDEGYIFQETTRTAPISYRAMDRFAHLPETWRSRHRARRVVPVHTLAVWPAPRPRCAHLALAVARAGCATPGSEGAACAGERPTSPARPASPDSAYA